MSALSQLFKRLEESPPQLPASLPAEKAVARPALHVVTDMLPYQEELARITGLDEKIIQDAADRSRRSGNSIGDTLLRMKKITVADLIEAKSLAKETPFIDKLSEMPEWDKVIHASKSHDVVAIGNRNDPRKRGFIMFVATSASGKGGIDSLIVTAMNDVIQQGWKFAGRIRVTKDFFEVVKTDYKNRAEKARLQEEGRTSDILDSQLHADFDQLVETAYNLRASDIHITLRGGFGHVKFRVDGELESYQDWTEEYTRQFLSSVYNTLHEDGSVKYGFSVLEKQDAAIQRKLAMGLVRLRYAHIPITPDGLDVTLRIIPIDVTKKQQNMGGLGYSRDQQTDLDRMFAHSSGLIFFLGTTGSGKSTSMAVALEAVARAKPGKKIRTVEQPVEYRIEGAYQTSVDREGFISMISQLMRMDPDYMMIGETRDNETAAAVLQAARSGHLCVSTLHADGAPLAYDRLQGLGVPRTELASVGLVVGVVYQKLVPLLCSDCKITAHEHASRHPDDPVLERVRRVNGGTLDGIYMSSPGGCPSCRGRGFKGRTVCAEILRPSVSMLSAIAEGNSRDLWRAWRATIDPARPDIMRGRTAFEHAIWKMQQGEVSPVAVESEFRFLDEPPFEEA